MKSDLISIIVPIYDLEENVERTVNSILNQTYQDIEVILVDDGSIDRSGRIIDEIAKSDSRVKTIHKENEGVTSARIDGVKVATGEWIGFVDGDDVIEPDMYERLLVNAIKYQSDISHCGYQMVFEDGRIHFFYNTDRIVQQDNLTGLKDLLSGSFVEPGLWNKLFHKDLFHNLLQDNKMDFSIKNNEDLLMNFILFSNSKKSVYEDFCPYHYLIRQSSASRQTLNTNRIYDPIKVKRYIIDMAPQEIKSEAKVAYLNTCLDVYNSLLTFQGKIFKQDRLKVRSLIIKSKADTKLLNRRRKILAEFIIHVPHIYPIFYIVYSNMFQNKKYE